MIDALRAVVTRKARGRPKPFVLTAYGAKTWSAQRSVFFVTPGANCAAHREAVARAICARSLFLQIRLVDLDVRLGFEARHVGGQHFAADLFRQPRRCHVDARLVALGGVITFSTFTIENPPRSLVAPV